MNGNSIDREVYLLLTSFLAEVEAVSTNRTAYVELTNPGTDIQEERGVTDEYENLNQRNESDRQSVLLDMRDITRAKILKKYYRLLLLLDHVTHRKLIDQLDLLYECFCAATYDIELIPDIGCFVRDVIDGIKTNKLKPAYSGQ
ncbi:hypothetical protein BA6E_1242 [Bacteroidales bacterium 6E]|nr:hypothetical protein BA6E_1242 [Bacteroidales bacterium 6E]